MKIFVIGAIGVFFSFTEIEYNCHISLLVALMIVVEFVAG